MAARRGLGGAALVLCAAGGLGALAAWPISAALWPAAPRGLHPEGAEALDAAAAAAPSPRAFQAESEAGLRSFLRLVATELNLAHQPIELVAAPAEGGVVAVQLRWVLHGDPFDLPPLLAAFEQVRHTVALERVDVRPDPQGGGVAELRVQARLLRAVLPEPAHFDGALQARGGLDEGARAQLADAAVVLAWRLFRAAEEPLRVEAERRRRSAQRELPAALIAARRSGAPARWSAERGLVVGLSPERPAPPTPD